MNNNYNEMWHWGEQISALLDGELSGDASADLFTQLSLDSGLREEFQSQIEIKQLFQTGSAIPPFQVTENVFNHLAPIAAPIVSKYAINSYNFMLIFVSSIITFLATWAYFGNSFEQPLPNIELASSKLVEKSTMQLIVPKADEYSKNPIKTKNSIPVVKSYSSEESEEKSIKDVQIVDKINIKNELVNFISPTVTMEYFEFDANQEYSFNLQHSSNVGSNSLHDIANEKHTDLPIPNFSNGLKTLVRYEAVEMNWALEMRGFTNNSSINNGVEALDNPLINNMTISLLNKLTQNWSVGIEIGQENYMQTFKGISGQRLLLFEQNFLASWAGLSVSYEFSPSSNHLFLSNYTKSTIGACNVGAILRLENGFKMMINDNFAMFAGLNLNTLVYGHQEILYNSMNYGVCYGLAVNF